MKIFSGVRPSGELHIGNYLGAIKQWLKLQEENDTYFCIVDLHGITTPYDPKTLQDEIRGIAISYLAAGLDPNKSTIFIQSKVKSHAEFSWMLSTLAPLGRLERMTQFKEKSAKDPDNINLGLLGYPVLMAADILLYRADKVPVGEDQVQHLELTRDLARKFNNKFGEMFKEPETLLPKEGKRIMSLSNPSNKMSKSDGRANYISLFDTPDEIKEKVMSAKTDTGKEIKYDNEKKKGVSNLITLYSLFSDSSIKEVEKEFQGKSYKEFKESLVDVISEGLSPLREKKKELEGNHDYIEKVLKEGEEKAKKVAEKTMKEVKEKMGLL